MPRRTHNNHTSKRVRSVQQFRQERGRTLGLLHSTRPARSPSALPAREWVHDGPCLQQSTNHPGQHEHVARAAEVRFPTGSQCAVPTLTVTSASRYIPSVAGPMPQVAASTHRKLVQTKPVQTTTGSFSTSKPAARCKRIATSAPRPDMKVLAAAARAPALSPLPAHKNSRCPEVAPALPPQPAHTHTHSCVYVGLLTAALLPSPPPSPPPSRPCWRRRPPLAPPPPPPPPRPSAAPPPP